jgi:hypothetical protein
MRAVERPVFIETAGRSILDAVDGDCRHTLLNRLLKRRTIDR